MVKQANIQVLSYSTSVKSLMINQLSGNSLQQTPHRLSLVVTGVLEAHLQPGPSLFKTLKTRPSNAGEFPDVSGVTVCISGPHVFDL